MPKIDLMSPVQLDAEAHAWWRASTDTAVVVVEDDTGKKTTLSGSDRMERVNRNARRIVSSTLLATAVVKLLEERGVTAAVEPLLVDPASGEERVEVLGVRVADVGGHELVLPMVPGAAPLRLYAVDADGTLSDDPVAVVAEPAVGDQADQWVSAADLATAMIAALPLQRTA